MPRILYITPVLAYPPTGGPYLRVANSIKALSQVGELHLMSRVSPVAMGGQTSVDYFHQLVNKMVFAPSVKRQKQAEATTLTSKSEHTSVLMSKMLRTLPKLFLFQLAARLRENHLARITAEQDAAFVVEYAIKHKIKVLWFGYGNISAELIERISQIKNDRGLELKIVVDTDSVWSRFILRRLPFTPSILSRWWIKQQGSLKERQEKIFVRLADVVTAVSDVDAEYYRSLTSQPEKVYRFSNVIDLEAYKENFSEAIYPRPFIFFAGYFGPDSPTDLAARWIIKNVLPRLEKVVPDLDFLIAGKGSAYTLSDIRHPKVKVLGTVPTVVPYLKQAMAALVPLKFESGTRFKILEAGACKTPVISTTLGAEGIEVTDQKNIIIADDPTEFTQAIQTLYQQPSLAKKLGLELHQLVRTDYSLDSLVKEAKAILTFLT